MARNEATTENSNQENNNNEEGGINQEACAKYGITLHDLPTEPVEPYTRYNKDDTVYGFVTEVTHDQKGTEIEIKDWGYCLEDNTIELGFQEMHRSEIMEEVIKTYGLVPLVDFTDLEDDVISWDNSTSKNHGGGTSSDVNGTGEIADLVRKWCEGKTSDLEKAKAIHNGLMNDVGIYYSYYNNFKYDTPEECLEHHQNPGLNCGDTSQLTTACMTTAGLNSYFVLRCDHEHFFTVIEINGQKYYSDLTADEGQRSHRAWNTVWQGNTCGSKYTR